jgi:hypothetical protein
MKFMREADVKTGRSRRARVHRQRVTAFDARARAIDAARGTVRVHRLPRPSIAWTAAK